MPLPPQGEDGAPGTINIAQVILSDEEEFYNSDHNPSDAAPRPMDLDSNSSPNNNENTHSINIADRDDKVHKNKPVKLFNLDADKYYSNSIFVYIEKVNKENLGRLHPLVVGHILHKKLCIKNIIAIKSVGFNRIKVQLKTFVDANLLVNNKLLIAENLRAFIPNHLLEKKGLIRGVDTYFDNEYLIENVCSPTKVLNVERMLRKTEKDNKVSLVPKQTVIITFQGNVLPNEIIINSVIFPVEIFYGKVIQCYHCLKYGHVSKQCRSTNPLCINCGKSKNNNHECSNSDTFCIYCKNNDHKSNSKNCPTFEEQRKIKKIMIDNSTSFVEAKEYCDKSFANFTSFNKYDLLPDSYNYDANFPSLPSQEPSVLNNFASRPSSITKKTFATNKNHVSLSQPIRNRNYEALASGNNKKRKMATSPPSSPTPLINLNPSNSNLPSTNSPFRFKARPSTYAFSKCHNSEANLLDKNKISECLSRIVFEFLENISSLGEVRNINLETIKQKMRLVLEGTNFP